MGGGNKNKPITIEGNIIDLNKGVDLGAVSGNINSKFV